VNRDFGYDRQFKTVQMVAKIFVLNIFIFGAMAFYLKDVIPVGNEESVQFIRIVFIALTMTNLVLIALLKKYFLKINPLKQEQSKKVETMASHSIAFLCLADSPALLGFVLFLYGHHPIDFFLFSGISLVALYVLFPRQHHWEEYLNSGVHL